MKNIIERFTVVYDNWYYNADMILDAVLFVFVMGGIYTFYIVFSW